jgi:competence protein ComGC
MFVEMTENLFLLSGIASNTLYKIKKNQASLVPADMDRHQKIETLVLAGYISRHQTSIFKNKKIPNSDLGP